MPTARDLLEQADALMRRNRARAEDQEIPTLHDAVVPPASDLGLALLAERPASIGRVVPEESDADVAAAEAGVDEGGAAVAAANDVDDSDQELDDVPLLTDAVEEIEAPSILDAPPNEGEDSLWLVEPGSEDAPSIVDTAQASDAEPAQQAAPSRAPDIAEEFIFEVPPLDEEEPGRPQPPDAAFDTQLHSALTVDVSPAHEWPEVLTTTELPAESADDNVAETTQTPEAAAPAAADAAAALSLHAVEEGGEPEVMEDAGAASYVTGDSALPLADSGAISDADPDAQYVDELPHDEALPSPSMPAATPVPPPQATLAEPAAVDDSAQWIALAEEIRMQVLQRIDLFTDTGLREQLGARLKPIVDRASADLVATINQHVGMLLRAYVAEAIEREIEKWRENGKK